jgi:hypothetical protein
MSSVRFWGCLLAVVMAASLSLPDVADAVPRGKRKLTRHWQGHGFLPGYRTPKQIRKAERRRELHFWSTNNGIYWYRGYGYGSPGWYRGRWNGGSFGPCWTQTPIGPMWNCG